MTGRRRLRLRLVPSAIVIALTAVLVGLGLWQLDRAAEKEALAAMFADDAPYRSLDDVDDAVPFQRIEARGRLETERQVLIDNMFLDGRPGLYAITAFRYANDEPLLIVNRGWIARPSANEAKPDLVVAGDTVSYTHLTLPTKA